MTLPAPDPMQEDFVDAKDDLLVQLVDETQPMDDDPPAVRDSDVSFPLDMKPEVVDMLPELKDGGVRGSYTWVLEDFSTSTKLVATNSFEAAGLPWHLNVYPRGNKTQDTLAIFLAPEQTQAEQERQLMKEERGEGWCRNTDMSFTVINHKDPKLNVFKQTSTTYFEGQEDWGFSEVLPDHEILAVNSGFLVDDCLTIKTDVVVRPPQGEWYDSKAETGYVGLKNQGATCYLNSWLQTLFHINYFRKAVFDIPTTEEDDPEKSISLALQTLLYKMQFLPLNASTADLTRSFGWDQYGALMQEDVHEFNKILCDALDEKMKGTKVEGVISRLFEGHIQKSITCLNVPYKSAKRDAYMDIFLDVRNCKNLYDSFDRLTAKERMDGDNQYNAEGFGMQDAELGDLFDSFPAVLQLHLKRFEYDFERDIRVKVNDRYEFDEELDLDIGDGKYLSLDADRSKRNKYKLHSVLVHSGGTHGGHYYAFSRPDGEQWLKFEDEQVTKEDRKAAMEDQFGGEASEGKVKHQYSSLFKSQSAYMLVYVRETEWDEVMRPVTEQDVALHLRERVRREQAEKLQQAREEKEKHLYTVIKAARDQDMQDQIGSSLFWDLVDFDKVQRYRLKRETPFSEFQLQIAGEWGVPVELQRWWLWTNRGNGTLRPSRPVTQDEYANMVADIKPSSSNVTHPHRNPHQHGLRLYLEVLKKPAEMAYSQRANILLFFKFYEPVTRSLRYVHSGVFHKVSKLHDMADLLCTKAGLPIGTPLAAYEEVKSIPTPRLDAIRVEVPIGQHGEMTDGDIVCFEAQLPDNAVEGLQCPSVKDFMEYVLNRLNVTFINLDDPKDDGMELELLKGNTYGEITAALGAKLQLLDADHLQLTPQSVYSKAPKMHPVQWGCGDSLEQLLGANSTLYYRVLDLPLQEWQKTQTVKVEFHDLRTEEVGKEGYRVRVAKQATVEELLEEVRKAVDEPAGDGPLRLLEVRDCRIHQVFAATDLVSRLDPHGWTMRAEPVAPDEENILESERMLHVYHIQYQDEDPKRVKYFGNPFLIRIELGERLADIKTRIQAKLGVKAEDFASWRWSWHAGLAPPEELSDDDSLESRLKRSSLSSLYCDYLGVEHADSAPRRKYRRQDSSRAGYERPMKILA